ncbi:MAG: ABC transporter permease, partial [Priestia megaterium]
MMSEKIKQLLKRPMLVIMIFFLPLIGTIISSSFLAKVQNDSKIPEKIIQTKIHEQKLPKNLKKILQMDKQKKQQNTKRIPPTKQISH